MTVLGVFHGAMAIPGIETLMKELKRNHKEHFGHP